MRPPNSDTKESTSPAQLRAVESTPGQAVRNTLGTSSPAKWTDLGYISTLTERDTKANGRMIIGMAVES